MALFTSAKSSTAHIAPQLIPNEYGGGVSLILPERPERPRVEPERLTADDVVVLLGYTDASQIDDAQAIGFPRAVGFKETRHLGGVRRTPIYDGEKVREWRERIKRLANLQDGGL